MSVVDFAETKRESDLRKLIDAHLNRISLLEHQLRINQIIILSLRDEIELLQAAKKL
jgi:hypothetical protein